MRSIPGRPLLFLGAVGVALLGLGIVAIRPVRLDPAELRGFLERELGGVASIGSARWYAAPSPRLTLSQVGHTRSLLDRWPLHIAADRVTVEGLPLPRSGWIGSEARPSSAAPAGRPGYDRVSVEGLRLEFGPLELEGGDWTLTRDADRLRIAGWALGATGGRVDGRGEIDARGLPALRFYLSDLALKPFPRPTGAVGGALHLGGTIALSSTGRAAERFDVDLRAEGVRGPGRERWLDADLRGVLERSGGMLLPGTRIAAVGALRDVAGAHDLYAVHGPARATLTLVGPTDAPRVDLVANLRELRMRLGEAFEKPAGVPAFVRLEGRWSNGELRGARGRLDLGPTRVRIEQADAKSWSFSTSWLSIDRLRALVPALDRLPKGLVGTVRVSGRWGLERGIAGEVEVRDARLRLDDDEIRLASGRVHFGSDFIHIEAPGLQLEEEQLDLWVHYAGTIGAAPLRLRVGGRAAALDLGRVADVLEPILGAPLVDPTLEDVLREVVYELRARPRLLRRLEIAPSVLRVDRLRGMGMHADGALIRLEFHDQILHLGCADGEGGMPDESVSVEFTSGGPRVTAGR
jgi:hypothetical protein